MAPEPLRLRFRCCGIRTARFRAARFALARHLVLLTLLAASIWIGDSRVVRADDVGPLLTGYRLTSWHIPGIPRGEVFAIAQDHDGYLWIGTRYGLMRFDGDRFLESEALSPAGVPKGSVQLITIGRDGGIWASIRQGSTNIVSHISRGHVRNYDSRDGLDVQRLTVVVENASGTVWIGGESGLFRLIGDRWIKESAEGSPSGVLAGFSDESGISIVATNGVFHRASTDSTFARIHAAAPSDRGLNLNDVAAVTLDDAGTTFISDPLRGFRELDQPRQSFDAGGRRETGRGYRLLYDEPGSLWVGTYGQGLWRVRFGNGGQDYSVQKSSELTGLPSDVVFALMKDRDGNIWAGTSDGLCRLRRQDFEPVRGLGIVRAVAGTSSGDVWVGTPEALFNYERGTTETPPKRISLGAARLLALRSDSAGHVWIATDQFLATVRGSQLDPVVGSEGLRDVAWLAGDMSGRTWAYDGRLGLVQLADGKLKTVTLPSEISRLGMIVGYADRGGQLWIALADGRVAVLGATGVRLLDRTVGLTGGVYHSIYEDSDGTMWLGGVDGLTRISGGRVVTLSIDRGVFGHVTAIVEDSTGVLWLGTPPGLIRLDRAEFERAVADPKYQPIYSVYSRDAGLAGNPLTNDWGGLKAIRASDGRLWFATNSGVTVVDSAALSQARRPHPVRIEAVVVDRDRLSVEKPLTLPKRTSKLEIDYTTLDLTSIYKSQFKYRLDGVDDDWIDAGARQEAIYANLVPRHYRFSVISTTDNNAAWNMSPAVIEFTIPPMFYETTIFRVLGGIAVVLALWMLWALRVQRLRKAFALVFAERLRLSREMHDTLLQGLVGLTLQCEAIANEFGIVSPNAKERIITVRKGIEQSIRDTRRSISDLRHSAPKDQRDLAVSLRAEAANAVTGPGVQVDFAVHGELPKCSSEVQEQLVGIAREAVANAVRHAQATRVQVDLKCERAALILKISDDGLGFDSESVRDRDSSYGLIGMRERAECVGGVMNVASRPNAGTSIEVRVPLRRTGRLLKRVGHPATLLR
jgi:signal transduction histidine kinase/ligand-binding sensor domain-containing protein